MMQDITLSPSPDERTGMRAVIAIGPEIPHGFSRCPVVRWRPVFDPMMGGPRVSQVSPIAESQQGITHFLSLLDEEISNITFSQWTATGASKEDIGDVAIGNNRILCLANVDAKFSVLGADPRQAATISARITDEIENLYRTAGVDYSATSGGPVESGVAKAFRFNDLAATLSALADSAEWAENQIWDLLGDGWGWVEVPSSKYADDFNIPDFSAELQDCIRAVVVTELPTVIRKKLVDRFTARNLPLTPEESARVEKEMLGEGEDDAGGAMPGPAKPSPKPEPAEDQGGDAEDQGGGSAED
jgi:hypothetical protein